jgi:hypothetical protein
MDKYDCYIRNIQNSKSKNIDLWTYIKIYFLIFTWVFSILFPFIIIYYTLKDKNRFYILLYIVLSSLSMILLYVLKKYFYDKLINSAGDSYKKYFNIEIKNFNIKKEDKKILCAEFPHGIFCCGYVHNLMYLNQNLGNFRHVLFPFLLDIPFWGDILKMVDAIRSNKSTVAQYMERGENIHILPGGFHEICLTENFCYNIYVPSGFIAMCIKYKYSIIPVLNLGENETMYVLKIPEKIYNCISKYIFKVIKIPVFIGFGKYFTPIPENVTIWTIYGDPIECVQSDDETFEKAVDRIKKVMQVELQRLFDRNIKEYCKVNNTDESLYKLKIINAK